MRPLIAALGVVMALTGTRLADGAPSAVMLAPGSTVVTFRAYALGMVALDGVFGRFRGTLSRDDAQPGGCKVDLTVEATSLTMGDSDDTEEALGEDFLDAPHFAAIRFIGRCQGDHLDGALTMHGVTRAVTLARTQDATRFTAEAVVKRTDWGMTRSMMRVGSEIRIKMVTALPPGFSAGP